MINPSALWSLATALGIGLLLGMERERRKGEGPSRAAAGVRTFALVALLGALTALSEMTILVGVAALFVAGTALISYWVSYRRDPGLTSEVALVVAFVLGVEAARNAQLAAGLGVVVAILLASRSWLHVLVTDQLSAGEFHDALVFAAAALVVLPLMPDRGLGPMGAFNPFVVWRLVVIMMTISGFGHIALRLVGPQRGLPLSGLISGFVSSAATIGAFGDRATKMPMLTDAAVAGAILSTVATMIQMLLLLAATSPAVLKVLLVPLILAAFVAILYGFLSLHWAADDPMPDHLDEGRAFDPRTALVLSATVSAMLMLSALMLGRFGASGLAVATALAGLADTHAAAMSAAAQAVAGRVDPNQVALPILLALSTNTLTKLVVAYSTGPRRYALQVGVGLVLVIAAAWAGWWLTGGRP